MAAPESEAGPSIVPTADGDNDSNKESKDVEFKTIQEKVDSWTNDSDGLEMGVFRLDPPKPFGQLITVHISLTYKGINSSMPMQLTRDDRGTYIASVLRTMNRLLGMSEPIWSREHHQFSRYTDLLVRLREDTCLLLYSYTGTLVSIPMFCRTIEEAEEVWQRYQSGDLEKEIRELFSGMYLPFGPVVTTIKIYDYEECKRNFQFAGYRLLYILYPHINRRRYY